MTTRTISIGIDPTKSTAGARVVKRDLESIGDAAQKVEQQTGRTRDALGRFVGASNSANDNLRKMSDSAGLFTRNLRALQAMAILAAGAIVSLVTANMVTTVIRYADTYKNLTSQLRLVTTSSEELASVQEKLFRLAQGSRSEYASTVNLYARLARSAKDLGLSQDALLKITDTINKAFIVSGANSTEASNSIIQLAQGLAAGALRGDEFNSVSEQAPRLLQAVADNLGMSTGQLKAFAAEGKITAAVLTESLFKAADKINDEFSKMSVTVEATGTVLRNSLLRAVGELDAKLGVSSGIAAGILAVARGVDALVANSDKLYKSLQIAGAAMLVLFSSTVISSVVALTNVIATGLTAAILGLNAAIIANPIVAVVAAIGASVATIYYFRDEIHKAIGVDVVKIFYDAANMSIAAFTAAFEEIKFVWNQFPDIISAAVIAAGQKMAEGINNMIDVSVKGLNWLREKVGADPINADDYKADPNTIKNPAGDRLGEAWKEKNQRVQEIFKTDYLGGIKTWWGGGSTPGTPPGLPGDGATLPGGLGSGQSADQLKKYNEIIQKGRQAIALQAVERQGIGLTEEAARSLRIEQELLNQAANDNIQLTPQQTTELKNLAQEMAASEAQTKKLRETFEFSKDTFKGFFSDLNSGLKQGQSFFEAFANSVVKALDKIAEKLLDSFLEDIFLGGSSGKGSGGIWGALSSVLGLNKGGGKATTTGAATAVAAAVAPLTAPVIPVTRSPLPDVGISAYAKAIKAIESEGSGGYSALGPITRNGDRAYGAYQIMGNNIGPWSKQALGYSVSSKEFMANPSIQDQIFNHKFGGYVNQYGASGAAQAWFGGPGSVGKGGGAMDILGTSGTGYVAKFNAELGKLGRVTESVTENLGGFGQGLGTVANSMTNFFPAAPSPVAGGGGGGLFSWVSKIFSPNLSKYAGLSGGLFDTGGYTGPGGRKDIAGIVHKGEVVFNQDDVQRHGGYSQVEAMRRGIQPAANGNEIKYGVSNSIGNVYVTVPEGTDTSDSDKIGKSVRAELVKLVDERMTDQKRVNGILDRGAF